MVIGTRPSHDHIASDIDVQNFVFGYKEIALRLCSLRA